MTCLKAADQLMRKMWKTDYHGIDAFILEQEDARAIWKEHFHCPLTEHQEQILYEGIGRQMPLDGNGCEAFRLAHDIFHILGENLEESMH